MELDSQLLDRIEITTEEIARNSTREFVDHEIQAMIDLFVNNLNITIDEVRNVSIITSIHRSCGDKVNYLNLSVLRHVSILFFFQLHQYSSHRNSSDFDDTRMKEFQKKGLIMFENTAITVEYIVYKISVLSKSSEELEQLEKYIVDEEKVCLFFFQKRTYTIHVILYEYK